MRKPEFTSFTRALVVLTSLLVTTSAWSGSHFNYQGVDEERVSLTMISVDPGQLRVDFSDQAGFLIFNADRSVVRLFDAKDKSYRVIGPDDLRYLRQVADAMNSEAGRAADAVLGAILGDAATDGANPVRKQLVAALGLPVQDMQLELRATGHEPEAQNGYICQGHILRINQQDAYQGCLAEPAEMGLAVAEIETLKAFEAWALDLAELWTELEISEIDLNNFSAWIPVTLQRTSAGDAATVTELKSITETLSLDVYKVPEDYRKQTLPWQR